MPEDTTLHPGSLAELNLDATPLHTGLDAVRHFEDDGNPDPVSGHPLLPGAVVLMAHHGRVFSNEASGWALRYADYQGTQLPLDRRIEMRQDTIFDLASLSKLFTSTVAVQQIERGAIALDAPVVRYLPEFTTGGKQAVTIEMLLTHTSGLPPDPTPSLWQGYDTVAARKLAVAHSPLQNPPGSTYLYSDLNMLNLALVVEAVTGKPLDRLVAEGITGPLRMTDTRYNPPAALRHRIAPTEFQLPEHGEPNRGLVWGQVHDENAWALDGVAGHAGVFSTAHDLGVLCQTMLNGGSYAHSRILREESVRMLFTDYNSAFPGNAHGLGFELDQMFYMGGLSGPRSAGHTGYTGTTLVIDFQSRSICLVLTNRVHPNRHTSSINPARTAAATGFAHAMAVLPLRGATTWFCEIGDSAHARLTTPALSPTGPTLLVRYAAFVHTDVGPPGDPLTLEWRTDGSNWSTVAVRAFGRDAPRGTAESLATDTPRSWWLVEAEVPARQGIRLRWHYDTDTYYTGRGINLDAIAVHDGTGLLLHGERDAHRFVAQGWRQVPR
ncbi:MAG: serine hydrolase domain-containing protein [Sciscionella sp.]